MAQWAKGREKENKNRMKVTIKMVAEKCNVSPVTVSRVLANHSSVNEKTRETVLNAMQELGYRSKKVEKLMKIHLPDLQLNLRERLKDQPLQQLPLIMQ